MEEAPSTPPNVVPPISVRVMPQPRSGAQESHAQPGLAAQPTPKGSSWWRRHWVIGVALGLFGLIAVAGAAALVWAPDLIERLSNPAATPAPTSTSPEPSTGEPAPSPVTPVPQTGPQTPQARDDERLKDMVAMHTALELYRSANGRYPQATTELIGYMSELPQDPSGSAYAYHAVAEGNAYEVEFTLEVGGWYNAQRLTAGPYLLTPPGVQIPSAVPPPAGPPPSPTSTPAVPPPSSPDADGDSLTDVEEALYTTDVANPDSDGDGYLDGVEVRGGFNPLNPQAQRLLEAGLVQEYRSLTQGYRIAYPTSWVVRVLDDPIGSQVTFMSATSGPFFEVIVEANPTNLTVGEWYEARTLSDSSALEEVAVGALRGIRSPDGLTVYLPAAGNIYAVTYSLGGSSEASYGTTFEAFLRSFEQVSSS